MHASALLGLSLSLSLLGLGCGDDTGTGGSGGTGGGGGAGGGAGGSAVQSGDLTWLVTGGGKVDDACFGAAEAADGVLVVLCGFGPSTWRGTTGEAQLTPTGEEDALLLGLDAKSGALLWTRPLGSVEAEDALVVQPVALTDGRVAAVVAMGAPPDVPGVDLPDVDAGDNVLFVVDSAGDVQSARRMSTDTGWPDDERWSMSPLPDGGLLLGINYVGSTTLFPGSADEAVLTGVGVGGQDAALVWLDADLAPTKTQLLGVPGGSLGVKAAPDKTGGIGITGFLRGSFTLGTSTPLTLTSGGDPTTEDAFVASLDGTGEPRWGFTFGGELFEYGRSIVQTADGGWVVVGYFNQALDLSSGGDPTLTIPGSNLVLEGAIENDLDLFVLSVSADGTPRWLEGAIGPGISMAIHVDAFDDGAVLVTGLVATPTHPEHITNYGDGTVTFSDGETVETIGTTQTVIRYEPDGTRGWTSLVSIAIAQGSRVLDDGSVAVGSGFMKGAIYGEGEPNEVTPLPPEGGAGDFNGAVMLLAP